MAEAKRTDIREISSPIPILTFGEKNLVKFLIKLIDGNKIYLDKYLIKIICLFFIYGFNTKKTLIYSNVEDFKKLLFIPNEFFTVNDSFKKMTKFTFGHIDIENLYIEDSILASYNIFISYLKETLDIKLNIFKKEVKNEVLNNTKSNESKTLMRLKSIANLEFSYNFIDFSKEISIRRNRAINMKNAIKLFKPSLIYHYFLTRIEEFNILAGSENNLKLLNKLIFESFVDDCMFDQTNSPDFHRYVNTSYSNNKSNKSKKSNKKSVKFTNNTKTHNHGIPPKRIPRGVSNNSNSNNNNGHGQ